MIFFNKMQNIRFFLADAYILLTVIISLLSSSLLQAKEKNVLITGASGHLGISLIETLLEDPNIRIRALIHENEVRIENLKRRLNATKQLDESRIETYKADIIDYESVKGAFVGVDAVFHLAAVISIQSDKQQLNYMRTVNIEGTRNVLKASKEAGVKYMIHCSSSHAYKHLQDRPLSTENGLVEFNELIYDATKAESQHLVSEFAKQHDDFHHVIVAPSGIIGRNDHPESDMWPLFERFPFIRFSPMTTGSYAFIDVQLLASVMTQALGQLMDDETRLQIDGEEFLVGGKSVSVLEMVQALQNVTGKPHCLNYPGLNRPIQLPLWMLKLIAPWYEFAANLLGFKAMITSYSIGVLGSLPHGIAEQEDQKLRAYFHYPEVSLEQTFHDRYQTQQEELEILKKNYTETN